MADFILYVVIFVIAIVVTKYLVPFILSIASIPHHLVSVVNFALYFAIFIVIFFIFYFLPQPRGLVYQIFADPGIVLVTPTSTPTKAPTQKPDEPTWTPASTPRPEPTWTSTKTPTQKPNEPTWTPTRTPRPAPTWTPTRTPRPAPTWTSTKIPPTPRPSTATAIPIPSCRNEPSGEFANLWKKYRNRLGCPLYNAPKSLPVAGEQPFQNGHMFYLSDRPPQVIVVYDSFGDWQILNARWGEDKPEYSCQVSVPAGLWQPRRGFGEVWCNQLGGPESRIGWALDDEHGFDHFDIVQDFENGIIFRDSDGFSKRLAYVLFKDNWTFIREPY